VRRPYIDWLRGIGVLIMIEAHVVDSWTLPAERSNPWYFYAIMLGGFGAPLFLFLAGTALAISASAKAARQGSVPAATRAVQRRGLEIFALAFLFRLQAMVLSVGSLRSLLKVDILNVMGPAIVLAATLWGAARRNATRLALLGAATLAFTLLTPIIRGSPALAALPDPLEWYLRPAPGLTTFTLFPWAGFVTAGAMAGVLLSTITDPRHERRLVVWLSAAGVALAAGGFAASFGPSPYANTSFWTTSPAFFMLRNGVLLAAIGLAYLWDCRPSPRRWSPIVQFGRTSLFIYWIHVEMVYGLVAIPIKRSLTLPWLVVAFVLFTAFLLWLSVMKDRWVERWLARRTAAVGASAAALK
jgi:uncharacterized membrane protein